MKALLLVVTAFCFAACDVQKMTGGRLSEPTPEPTPAPPTPKPTPKPGEWMFKNYKNPLEQKSKKD
jgi:hypothetical protein